MKSPVIVRKSPPKEPLKMPSKFKAFSLKRIGQLYVILTIDIEDNKIIAVDKSVEDMQSICLVKMEDMLVDEAYKS